MQNEPNLFLLVDTFARNLEAQYAEIAEETGTTAIELHILAALFQKNGQHASELARGVGRAATSFTPILDKMQHKGLIERRPDPADRRAVHIYLTDKGEGLKVAVMDGIKQVETKLYRLFMTRAGKSGVELNGNTRSFLSGLLAPVEEAQQN